MIALRKLFQVFGRGTLSFLNPSNRKILAYLRSLERDDGSHETVLCVANLSRFAQPVSLDMTAYVGMEPVEMLGYVPFPTITDAPYQLTLAPYSFLWLELQAGSTETKPIPYLPTSVDESRDELAIPELVTTGWAGLFSANGLVQLETSLLAWLPSQRWFGAKSRRIQSARVLDRVDFPFAAANATGSISSTSSAASSSSALVFVEIAYFDGAPDVYQIPLAISTGDAADRINATHRESVVVTLSSISGIALVHDATVLEDFRQGLLALIEDNAVLPLLAIHPPRVTGANSLAIGEEPESDEKLETTANRASDAAGTETSSIPAQALPVQAASADGLQVSPAPLDAQPGEAAAGPRSDEATVLTTSTEVQPREYPAAGDPGGRVEARASTALAEVDISRPLPSRVGSAEQSNSSILYGDKLILKLFRRLQPGENPDVEIGRFLTEVVHFEHVAPFLGEVFIVPANREKTTVAMLQGLVANHGDGWTWYLTRLADFFSRIADDSKVPDAPHSSFVSESAPASRFLDFALPSLEAARILGHRTAEMHLALSSSVDLPDFAPEPFTAEDLAEDARRIEAQVTSALETLKAKLTTLDEQTSDAAGLLLSKRLDLIARSRSIAVSTAAGLRIRIHGDYHLGQTLRTGGVPAANSAAGTCIKETRTRETTNGEWGAGDFVLLDFEGEPARSLAERRRKQSPLKDVAGMIRSFSYVAQAGLKRFLDSRGDSMQIADFDRLGAWAVTWQKSVSSEFFSAYRKTISTNNALLPPPQQAQTLLEAYLLEKGLYELLYELNNRPAWIHIPIAGIVSL
jgi:maltose alpha-D-glucosyltransferase/alpha-amylase